VTVLFYELLADDEVETAKPARATGRSSSLFTRPDRWRRRCRSEVLSGSRVGPLAQRATHTPNAAFVFAPSFQRGQQVAGA